MELRFLLDRDHSDLAEEVKRRYELPMVLPLACWRYRLRCFVGAEKVSLLAAFVSGGFVRYELVRLGCDGLITPAYIHSKINGAQILELVRNARLQFIGQMGRAGLKEWWYVPSRV